jgi:adenylate cyclase
MARRLAAIVFVDNADYSTIAQADEAGALRLLRDQESLVRPVLEVHHGHRVRSIGDDRLVEFPSALDAVEAAVDLQRRAHESAVRQGAAPIRIRVGIHLGGAERRGIGVLGGAVSIASRIGPLAEPGGVCLTESVYVQVRNKVPYQLERLGPRDVKGVREPIAVYRVVFPWMGDEAMPRDVPSPSLADEPLARSGPDPNDE